MFGHPNDGDDYADYAGKSDHRAGTNYFYCDGKRRPDEQLSLERERGDLQRKRMDFSYRCGHLHHHGHERGRTSSVRHNHGFDQRSGDCDSTG